MISFRDMTFCVNPNCTCDPRRKLTDEVRAAAEKWWGGPTAPIAMADLCGETEPPEWDWAVDDPESEEAFRVKEAPDAG